MTIEKTLFAAADKMRRAMDPGEYKHVALGLLFLSYISTAFGRKYEHLVEADGVEAAEDRDEYFWRMGIFWVPEELALAASLCELQGPEDRHHGGRRHARHRG